MKRTVAAALASLAGEPAAAQGMQIFPNGSRPSGKGPEAYFSGSARIDPQFALADQSRVSVGLVAFEPGARSAWHTHPAGQILIVASGSGWAQEWNGPKREIKAGDVVWAPPGVKHWHGASATNGLSHYAIQETVDGRNVDWMEKVSDEQYAK